MINETQTKENETRKALNIVLGELQRGRLYYLMSTEAQNAYQSSGLSLGNLVDYLISEGIKTMRESVESSDRGEDIYATLLNDSKKIAQAGSQCPIIKENSNNESIKDFYQSMLIVARSFGDSWLISDCQRILKGDQFADRLEGKLEGISKKFKKKDHNFFHETTESRQKDPKRREVATSAIKDFLKKYENQPFNSEKYLAEQISQLQNYLGVN